jgi:flagellar motor switch protein FliN/FliY
MADDLKRILHLEVPLIVQIADRRMMLSEVISLTHGSIIELPKAIDEPLDILINNTPIGHGHAVKVSENFGVHVHDVTPMRDRVRAMGPTSEASAEGSPIPAAAAG